MVRKLLIINGLAIIGVVLFHADGMGFVAMFSWAHRYLPASIPVTTQVGSSSYYLLRIVEKLAIPCIPIFLFVSGYFVSIATGKIRFISRWKIVFSRIRVMLIPYIFWSIIVLLLKVFEGNRYSPAAIVKMMLTGQTNEVLYFIPLLIQFYLLSPFIVTWARKSAGSLIFLTAVLQILIQIFQYPYFAFDSWTFTPKWLFLARIFWFPLGVVAGYYPEKLNRFISRFKFLWKPATILLFLSALLEWEILYHVSGQMWLAHVETILDSLYSISMIFLLLSMNVFSLPLASKIADLGTKSFGIYLMHAIFIEYLARTIYHVIPGLLADQFILLLLYTTAGLGIPLVIMALVLKFPIRHYYRYLFG